MNENDLRVFQEFVRRVRMAVPDSRFWAYGSRARGDHEQDSDLDICVVAEELDISARQAISDAAFEVGFESGVLITTVKFTREQFERGPCSASPLVRAILREGVAA